MHAYQRQFLDRMDQLKTPWKDAIAHRVGVSGDGMRWLSPGDEPRSMPTNLAECKALVNDIDSMLHSVPGGWIKAAVVPIRVPLDQIDTRGRSYLRISQHDGRHGPRGPLHIHLHPLGRTPSGDYIWAVSAIDLIVAFADHRLLSEPEWVQLMVDWHKFDDVDQGTSPRKSRKTKLDIRWAWYRDIVIERAIPESHLAHALYCPSVDRDFSILAERYGQGPRAIGIAQQRQAAYQAIPRPRLPFTAGDLPTITDFRYSVWKLGTLHPGEYDAMVVSVSWERLNRQNHRMLYLFVQQGQHVIPCTQLLPRGRCQDGSRFDWWEGDIIRVTVAPVHDDLDWRLVTAHSVTLVPRAVPAPQPAPPGPASTLALDAGDDARDHCAGSLGSSDQIVASGSIVTDMQPVAPPDADQPRAKLTPESTTKPDDEVVSFILSSTAACMSAADQRRSPPHDQPASETDHGDRLVLDLAGGYGDYPDSDSPGPDTDSPGLGLAGGVSSSVQPTDG